MSAPTSRRRALLGPTVLGLVGSLAIVLAGPQLAGGAVRWWYHPALGGGASDLLYGGMTALVLAWGWLGSQARRRGVSARMVAVVAGAWALPLLLGPPLFSHDLYSYLAQGTIAHLGLSPYRDPPSVLVHLGHPGVLRAVSPFWRGTTAPYGPMFLWLVSLTVGATGSNLVLGAIAVRLIEMGGLGLLVWGVPRLATRLGGSPALAQWLAVANPLVLLGLVAPGHNDLLMAGLTVAGAVVALRGHPLAGIAICALAATVKVPALAATVFVTFAWAGTLRGQDRVGAVMRAGAVTLGVLGLVSLASGLGLGWLSSGVFSTPNRVHLAITPSTALGWSAAALLHDLGLGIGARHLESVLGAVTLGVVAVFALVMLRDLRWQDLPQRLGLVLLAFAVGGPAAWPWYLSWGLVLVAASPMRPRVLAIAGLVSLAGAFVVKPNGILALPLGSAPIVLGVYVAGVGAAGWLWWRGRRRAPGPQPPPLERSPAPELAQIR